MAKRRGKKNLKHQLYHSIQSNFKEGMDKHSDKKNGIRSTEKVYSYADRKNLIDLAANFANWMKENHQNIRMVRDLKSDYVQEFLNKKSIECSSETLRNYASRFRKLEKMINNTYNLNIEISNVVVPMGRNNTKKIRDVAMSIEDYKKLESTYTENSTGYIAINIARRSGLRVSEIAKLKGTDINMQEKYIQVIGGKGKKDRVIPISSEDLDYYKELKEMVGDGRCCAAQEKSISKNVNRHMKQANIKQQYESTGLHAIRKMYAQNEFDGLREQGLSIKEAWSKVSVSLGHGPEREKLMTTYIKNIH